MAEEKIVARAVPAEGAQYVLYRYKEEIVLFRHEVRPGSVLSADTLVIGEEEAARHADLATMRRSRDFPYGDPSFARLNGLLLDAGIGAGSGW